MNVGASLVSDYLCSGCPFVYVRTLEETRILDEVVDFIESDERFRGVHILVWRPHTGLYRWGENPLLESSIEPDINASLRKLIGKSVQVESGTILFMFGLRHYIQNPETIHLLSDIVMYIKSYGSHIVAIGPSIEFPQELIDIVTIVDYPLPTKVELEDLISDIVRSDFIPDVVIRLDDAPVSSAAENAVGMSKFRAESATFLSISSTNELRVDIVQREKSQLLKQTDAIQYVNVNTGMDSLGGFAKLKSYINVRKKYFEDPAAAAKFGVIHPPRGILLVGLPGTGKSLAARCIASALGLSLYRFDVGAVFKSFVGESEASMRHVLSIIEAVAPCVLLIDEFEKAVSGLDSSDRSDSGITSRVVGSLLTWMQDTEAPVYKIGTANSVVNLDGALTRRGRWDAVFAVDLPQPDERMSIFSIHLKARGYSPEEILRGASAVELIDATAGMSGAEIEGIVEEAVMMCFANDSNLTSRLLSDIALKTPRVSGSGDYADSLRKWLVMNNVPFVN